MFGFFRRGCALWHISSSKTSSRHTVPGETLIHALDGASFEVERGELAVILGASGAGKTTALNILGGMDTLTSGDVSGGRPRHLARQRGRARGVPPHRRGLRLSVLQPRAQPHRARERRAREPDLPGALDAPRRSPRWASRARLANFPAQLSGGEQQRVSIARAIAKNPKLLLCDEPTGALDYQTGKQILQLLQDTCRRDGITVIIITHNSALAPMADRLIRFKSGKVTEMSLNPAPTPIANIEW